MLQVDGRGCQYQCKQKTPKLKLKRQGWLSAEHQHKVPLSTATMDSIGLERLLSGVKVQQQLIIHQRVRREPLFLHL